LRTMINRDSGLLELEFIKPENGRTGICHRRQRFPLFMTAPLYIDPNQPDMAFVYVQNPSGAAFAGDRLELKVSAGPGAKVHVTTPSATKIYRMESDFAVQTVDLNVMEGAVLEYIPEMTIPFAGSDYEQHLSINVAKGGVAILTEMIAPGRLARGEEFAFDRLLMRTKASVDGQEVLCDTIHLEPAKRDISVAGLMGDNKYMASLITITPGYQSSELALSLHNLLQSYPNVLGSACLLYNDNGIMVRIIGKNSIDVSSVLFEAWSVVRRSIIGTNPPRRRKA
jgi:urease accessory protein